MAMIWPSIHNQTLYPLTFTYDKGADISIPTFYFIYAFALLLVVLVIFIAHRRHNARRFFSNKALMAAAGGAGAIGIVLLETSTLTTGASALLVGIGLGLAAIFLPTHFLFWSIQLTHESKRRVAFDLVLSYLIFCLITALRLALHIHSNIIAIIYPLVSAVLAVLALECRDTNRFAYTETPHSSVPLGFLIPSILLVYLAAVSRILLTPEEVTYNYPENFPRIIMYLSLAVFMVLMAFLYRPKGNIRRYADSLTFTFATIFLIGFILLAGIGAVSGAAIGNYPAIAGIAILELFIWILVLTNSQIKHVGIIGPGALYLVFVLGLSRVLTVFFVYSPEIFRASVSQLPIIAVTVGLAFLIVVIAMLVMAIMLYRTQRRSNRIINGGIEQIYDSEGQAHVRPEEIAPYAEAQSEEAVYQNISVTFGLSKRETDTLRLAAHNESAKEIADILFVAESTVNSHIKSIYRKCDVHSRRELIALVNRFKKDGS